MVDAVHKSQVDSLLRNHLGTLLSQVETIAENHLIFEVRDLERLLPKLKIDSVPFKKLVLQEIHPSLVKKQESLAAEIQDSMEHILRDISEIEHIVDFNMETAVSVLQKKGNGELLAEAKNVAIEGLDRSKSQINDLMDRNSQIEKRVQDILREVTFEYVSDLQTLEDSEKVLALKLNLVRANAKEKLKNYGIQFRNVFIKNLNTGQRLSKDAFLRLRGQYFRLRKMTGFAPAIGDLEEKLAHYLTDTQQQISGLPSVYQRLFRLEPLSDEKFFVGRIEELEMLEKNFTDWQGGVRASVAIIGEKGSGRTTLLHFAEEGYFKKQNIIRINLVDITIATEEGLFTLLSNSFADKDASNLDELEARLLEKEEPVVCVLENMQNLFLRTVGGFEAAERLLLFFTRTNNIVFWIVTCTLYSWKYLDKVLNVSKYFQRIIELGAIPNQEIENIILKRHRISGYTLRFEIPERFEKSRKFKKLSTDEKKQNFLRQNYFSQLNEFAAGNVSIAILFWLAAIKDISRDSMVLSPSLEFDYSFLNQLDTDELFTLAALLQHETLSAEEHALIFHQDIEQSLLLFNRMCNRRILLNVQNRFQIHHLLFRPVVRMLKTRNIIY